MPCPNHQHLAPLVASLLSALAKLSGDSTMGIQQVLLLLALYTYGQLSQQQLETYTGVTRSSNSRNIAKLGPGEKPWLSKGPGWVESYEDPMNRRTKMVRLTPTGTTLIRAALEQVQTKT